MREEYELELTRDMKGELEKMGGLMEPLLAMAAEEAKKKYVAGKYSQFNGDVKLNGKASNGCVENSR